MSPMPTDPEFDRPPLVLVATHSEWAGRAIQSILRADDYAVVRAGSGRHALSLARTMEPDAIILDYGLPNLGGLEVCHLLHDDQRLRTTPVLVTSIEAVTRSERMAAHAAGAWGCFGAPLDGELMLTQLRNLMRARRACTQWIAESLVDQRTGLYSVCGLRRRLSEMAGEARRSRASLACILFCPDEAAGERAERSPRAVSERMIVELSRLLRREARCSDVLGRPGRTELAVVAPTTTEPGALRLIARYRHAAESAPLDVDGVPRPLQLRAGYAAADFAVCRLEGNDLLLQAAAALRGARASGPDRRVLSFTDTAGSPC